MRKFKLIKSYPGSPKVGTIIEENSGLNCLQEGYDWTFVSSKNIKDYPEFWSEVKERSKKLQKWINKHKDPDSSLSALAHRLNFEMDIELFEELEGYTAREKAENLIKEWLKEEKEYEVLTLIPRGGAEEEGVIEVEETYDGYVNLYKDKEDFIKCFTEHVYDIHSIKRTSDNQILTLGDKLKGFDKYDLIDGFFENHKGNKLWVSTNKEKGHGCALSVAQKEDREALFVTEDGAKIFEGDEYYHLDTNTWILSKEIEAEKEDVEGYRENPQDLFFSNKVAAEKFILFNKKSLRLKDVFQVYPQYKKKEPETLTAHAEQLIKKAKINL
jgi:hypothetical protein